MRVAAIFAVDTITGCTITVVPVKRQRIVHGVHGGDPRASRSALTNDGAARGEALWTPWAIGTRAVHANFARHISRIRNSFWYLHQLYNSQIECYEGDVYDLPPDIAKFDIAVFGSVLLHCCSPVKILQSVGNLVEGHIVICERYFADLAGQPVSRLLPSRDNGINETWWEFSPLFFQQYLGVLGFPNSSVTRHRQWYAAGESWVEMFTVVAAR